MEPFPAYQYVYPLDGRAVSNLAYQFTYGYREPQDVEEYTRPVVEAVRAWRAAFDASELFAVDDGSTLQIWDLRPGAGDRLTVLTGLLRALYLACDAVRTRKHLVGLAKEWTDREGGSETALDGLFAPLEARGFLIREGESYLATAVLCGEFRPRESVLAEHGLAYDDVRKCHSLEEPEVPLVG